jgi:hypothetical protein
MTSTEFYKRLTIFFLISVILYAGLSLAVNLNPYLDLFIVSSAFFLLYCVALFYLSRMSAQSKVKNQFIHLVLYNVFIKIILSFVIIFIYFKVTEPQDKLFIVPFILCYFVYTIFETNFMSRMARTSR